MPQQFTITAEKITNFAKKVALKAVHEATDFMYMEIQKMSPIRTGEYASSHRNLGVRIE